MAILVSAIHLQDNLFWKQQDTSAQVLMRSMILDPQPTDSEICICQVLQHLMEISRFPTSIQAFVLKIPQLLKMISLLISTGQPLPSAMKPKREMNLLFLV